MLNFSVFNLLFQIELKLFLLSFFLLKLSVYLIFLLFWSTFVYDLIAFWNWSPNGWLAQLGSLDFAGGTTVHITAGFSALAYEI